LTAKILKFSCHLYPAIILATICLFLQVCKVPYPLYFVMKTAYNMMSWCQAWCMNDTYNMLISQNDLSCINFQTFSTGKSWWSNYAKSYIWLDI